jgi:hypothetical protein
MRHRNDDEQVGLAAASAVLFRQIAADQAGNYYDFQHYSEVLNLVASALAKLAPISTGESPSRRLLTEQELLQGKFLKSATLLAFDDGRAPLSALTIRRADLREASELLLRVGITGFPQGLVRAK